MKTPTLAVAGLFALAPPALAEPPMPTHSTDAGKCTWEWKVAGDLGVWAERCALDTGLWEIRERGDLPGFVLTIDGEEEATVLQVFEKGADADVAAILPVLRQKGYIPDDDDCLFEPAAIRAAPRTIAFLQVMPTGARKAAFEATPEDEVPTPPCGDYGWSTHGIRYFMTDIRRPNRVVYVNTGEDGLMFDETTVTLEQAERRAAR